tara:strand:- start:108 stop:344 length:237 start_codon:yes stop_codon:yes gene_type:complete
MSDNFESYLVDLNGGEVISAHVHVGTSYVANLYKNNWAYEKNYNNKNGLPKLKDSATVRNIYEETSKLNEEIQDQKQD